MTSTFWLRLWWLFRLGMLLFAATFPLPTSLAYGGQSQRSVAYDRSGESTVGYDAVSELTTTERKNGTAGDRVYFGKVGGGLAAETTAGSLEEAAALQARAQELNRLRDSWMAGYVHLVQIAFPSNEDAMVSVDWPFGEAVFHVFAKKKSSGFGFRYIWA